MLTIAVGTSASAAGPGGWDHLGDAGTAGSRSLNGTVSALHETPGALYVGGNFTDAGGNSSADRIASWDGTRWRAVSSATSEISNGIVMAITTSGGKVFAGGTFQNAGGNANADFLAVWDGSSWSPFCTSTGPAFGGNVVALQIIGSTLYAGGSFQNGAGIASADYLLACNLATGASSSTVVSPAHPFSGSVYALTADSTGVLYAGGGFNNLENIPAADNVAYRDGAGWHALGAGGGPCGCAVNTFVRSLAADGTDVYVGTNAKDVAGIAQADNVVKWNGSAWSALGSGTGGADGWFPAATSINALRSTGSKVIATGSFLNANGDARADHVAYFDEVDGNRWRPVRSDGAGNGPWNGTGLALAVFDQFRLDGVPIRLYAGGSFTSAGGDVQAQFATSIPLSMLTAPTVPPPDRSPPKTTLRNAQIGQAKRTATFRFSSNEAGSSFLCKLDKQAFKRCTSPSTYKNLKRGMHEFRVKARDRAGNVDATPTIRKFRITG